MLFRFDPVSPRGGNRGGNQGGVENRVFPPGGQRPTGFPPRGETGWNAFRFLYKKPGFPPGGKPYDIARTPGFPPRFPPRWKRFHRGENPVENPVFSCVAKKMTDINDVFVVVVPSRFHSTEWRESRNVNDMYIYVS